MISVIGCTLYYIQTDLRAKGDEENVRHDMSLNGHEGNQKNPSEDKLIVDEHLHEMCDLLGDVLDGISAVLATIDCYYDMVDDDVEH